MSSPINNMMVESVRSGKASGVAGLFSFQIATDVFDELDYVSGQTNPLTGEQMEVVRRSVWSWAHEAPVADGVEVCWGRWEPLLDKLSARARTEKLREGLNQAVRAAMFGGHGKVLAVTWERMLGYTLDNDLWTRSSMLSILETQSQAFLSQGVPVLRDLNDIGHVVRPDFIAWLSRPESLMDKALHHAEPDLVQFLVGVNDWDEKTQQQWIDRAENRLIRAIDEGEWEFISEGGGINAVKCLEVLHASYPNYRFSMSPELQEELRHVEKTWKSIPAVLREKVLDLSLPTQATPRRKGPRF
jgi:hypothetical protein